ncbi:MAG: hypothetical protein JKY67_16480, partial [Pseudomonadales bacterium]|nr:hypothetical protein [Pseudomonadales bacterium]
MTSQQQQEQQQRIEAIIAQYPDGARLQDIVDGLSNDASGNATPRRTLQSWLKRWVNDGYLRTTGSRRGVRYFLANASTDPLDLGLSGEE